MSTPRVPGPLPPHWLDDVFTPLGQDAGEAAEGVLSHPRFRQAVTRAAGRALEAYREAEGRFQEDPGYAGPSAAQAARARFLEVLGVEVQGADPRSSQGKE